MLSLATIGTSEITKKFLAACRLTKRYNFKIAYSRDAAKGEAFRLEQGFEKSCNDLYELAASRDIDAVYIASPNAFHYTQSRLFLENGKSVICEKPIVTNANQYKELRALAEKNGVIYMEAIMSRHSRGREILRSAIKEIGSITQARLDYCQLSSRYNRFIAGEHVNAFDMSLAAGTLMDLGVYCVYAAVDLLGEPLDIMASAVISENKADSTGSAIFTYDRFLATLTYSKVGQNVLGSEIIGDKGTVKIGWISQYAGITLCKNGLEHQLFGYPERAEIMSGEAEKFADYIEAFESCKADYINTSVLTQNVHTCMDLIKKKANIKYPIKEYLL